VGAQTAESSAYAWQSHSSHQLAELANFSNELDACQEILTNLACIRTGSVSRHLVLAALVHYHRAFAGKCISLDNLAELGGASLTVHQIIIRAAELNMARCKDAFAETRVVVVTRAEIVERIGLVSLCRPELDPETVREWSMLISAIEETIVRPRLRSLEGSILKEAQTLGIQLVRQLPALRTNSISGEVVP